LKPNRDLKYPRITQWLTMTNLNQNLKTNPNNN
jgi:hypothetical protein